jgi:murein L,D-transpeptidase YafK
MLLARTIRWVAVGVTFGATISNVTARAHDPFTVLLVDKSKNQLHVGAYAGDKIEIKKTFHATLGKSTGDKMVEKDLKTPEGIYFFTAKLRPPSLKKKFGSMAMMMNYPNPLDQMAGKTGYDIMLHATDDPSRLQRDLDSEGCVVIDNPHIEEVALDVRLGLTPIIVYPELKSDYLKADHKPDLQAAFTRWLKAWGSKDIENYIGSYAANFSFNGMNLKRYKEYKNTLNQKYATIDVGAKNVRYFYHPKYDAVYFTQLYASTLKGGSKGFKSSGTKVLYFVQENGAYKIANESYSNLQED